jgi:hypothetical protein
MSLIIKADVRNKMETGKPEKEVADLASPRLSGSITSRQIL